MRTRARLLALGAFVVVAGLAVGAYLLLRPAGRDEEFGTVDEYRLDPWFSLDSGLFGVDVSAETIPVVLAVLMVIVIPTVGAIRRRRRPGVDRRR